MLSMAAMPLPQTPITLPKYTGTTPITWTVPGSKSLTNRAFVVAALAEGDSTLHGVLRSDDTDHMQRCLRQLGIESTDVDAAPENADDAAAGDFAATAVPNILPRVEAAFKDEPKAIQEATAVVLAALLAKSPRSYPAFLQSQYLQTQFPRLATDEEFIRQLETFIPRLTGE